MLIYLISLAMPGFVFRSDNVPIDEETKQYGYVILRHGWMGILIGQMAWYANVLFLAALVAIPLRKFNAGVGLSSAAFVFGLQSLFFHKFPKDESGLNYIFIDRLGVGFPLWELSFLLLAVYFFRKAGRSSTEP